MFVKRVGTGLFVLALLAPVAIVAQDDMSDEEWCENAMRGNSDRDRHCEVRTMTVSASSALMVDGGPNGGITVDVWDRNEIQVRARVSAWDEDGDAEDIVDDIDVEASSSEIGAEGPRMRGDRGWSVSYRLMVPRSIDLTMSTTNGGVSVDGVSGDLDVETTNGGLSFVDVSGAVRGHTTNGGVNLSLSGGSLDSDGIEIETTNGGVTIELDDSVSADLELSTTNGGISVDFPITVQGRIGRNIETELNGGGPPIRVETTNGGVRLRRR